jgi:hypothetical protein
MPVQHMGRVKKATSLSHGTHALLFMLHIPLFYLFLNHGVKRKVTSNARKEEALGQMSRRRYPLGEIPPLPQFAHAILRIFKQSKATCYHSPPQPKNYIEIGSHMAKTNYTFEKRQKEIAKKKKQEEKRQRKIAPQGEQPQNDQPQPPADEVSSA